MTQKMTHEFKIILLGESGVGKSSLIHTYTSGEFNSNRKRTRVVNLMSKELSVKGNKVKLCIWDTSSQEFFKNVVPNYYDGLLLVYDVTDIRTFYDLSDWLRLLRRKNDGGAALVVGNKTDLLDGTGVPSDVAMKYASDEHLEFMECSAKNGNNVAEIFEQITLKILETKNVALDEEFSCGASMSSAFSFPDDTSHEISSTISFPDNGTEHEHDSEELQQSNSEAGKLPLKPDVHIFSKNVNNHETTLKTPHQVLICKENGHPSMSQGYPILGENNTNNHETTLKNPQQALLGKEQSHPSMSHGYPINGDYNTDNHETFLKIATQISLCKEDGHPSMSQGYPINGDYNTDNHETTLKNSQQISLCKEGSHPSMSQGYPINGDYNTDNHETTLKNSQQISLCKEESHPSMSQGYPINGDYNTDNHETTLKNSLQTSECNQNGHSNISDSADLVNRNFDDDDEDMEEIESSFVFVSFLPPIVPLPDDVPLLRIGRRRTSADSVLSLMTETEINNVKLRAKIQTPDGSC